MKKILVCYATRYGSTGDIARIIGKELEAAGYQVSVSPIADVQDPGNYNAIVIGSPLYMGKWLAEARDFVSRFRHPLKERPVAVFSVGYSLKDRTTEHLKSGEDALVPVRIFINPVSTGLFPGKVDPDRMSAADRSMMKLSGATPGDFRDEDLVRSWARELGDLFHLKDK
ncbi:MAG: flavodoxin [Methanoregulaceae archaeon]|jgi:menaquinone-dependent protoporphyrinogen oxidase|nr:flavodoxin [Methanoregulaceae archaeon]MCU0629458.1 flavodoxin [Methanoregulaceae archaeon]